MTIPCQRELTIITPTATKTDQQTHAVVIIGGGPAGLMAADVLSNARIKVDVYDAMPSVGRKFLLAGIGGLNITHSEPLPTFLSRYTVTTSHLITSLETFTPDQLRQWVHDLGLKTFVGSSGRVFPNQMKAAPLLRAWLHRLRNRNVSFHMRHQWLGWNSDFTHLHFRTPEGDQYIQADAVILALGGGSWKKLGSTGAWIPLLTQRNINISPLKPANCGFNAKWSAYFREHFSGQPLKNIRLSFTTSKGMVFNQSGECIITEQGVEGNLIYALSHLVREEILHHNYADITIDLIPHKTNDYIANRLAQPRGKTSLSNYLRKRLNLDGVKIALLRENLDSSVFNEPNLLAEAIKKLPIRLIAPRPIDEAISSAGGVDFNDVDSQLMLHKLPGIFCAGEMLDWEAPTGGYLLTACFATGRTAGLGVLNWLQSHAIHIK